MVRKIFRILKRLLTTYWFIPTLMSVSSLVLAISMGILDNVFEFSQIPILSALLSIDAPGARSILSTIAGSAITVAGVIFSITILMLSAASNQFGPRLIPNFMKQRSTQLVIGGFIGTFIYCLFVLSTVRTGSSEPHIPQASVALGLGLGILSFSLLIYFIHNVSIFIQAPRIVEDVAHDLHSSLTQLRAASEEGHPNQSSHEETILIKLKRDSTSVIVEKTGYLQVVDYDRLCRVAKEHGMVMRVLYKPGHFVATGHSIAVASPQKAVDEEAVHEIIAAFTIGSQRTSEQDAEFAIAQLVETALRALSPGVNDPFTAINCIDQLGAGLSFLSTRQLPPHVFVDDENTPRVLSVPYTYAGFLDSAFNQLRQNAREHAAVIIRLLETVDILAEQSLPYQYRQALIEHARLIHEAGANNLHQARDRNDLEVLFQRAMEKLDAPHSFER